MVGRHRHRDEHSPEENNDDRDRHPQTLHRCVILTRRLAGGFPGLQRAWTVRTRSIEPNTSLAERLDPSVNTS